uniref:Uncharacterized protein n=1 Tax=Glossina pallidipes TaxID=7398 RepID=A0A1A9ZAL5_GLOPL
MGSVTKSPHLINKERVAALPSMTVHNVTIWGNQMLLTYYCYCHSRSIVDLYIINAVVIDDDGDPKHMLLLLILAEQTKILFLVYTFIGYGNALRCRISKPSDKGKEAFPDVLHPIKPMTYGILSNEGLMQPQHTILVCSLQETINKKLLTQVLPVSTTIATSASVSQSSKTYEQDKELF